MVKKLLHNHIFSDYKKYQRPSKVGNKLIGDLFDLKTFVEDINNKMLIDSDGYGRLVYRNQEIVDAKIHLMSAYRNKAHVSYKNINLNLLMLYYIFKDEVQIIWFNK